MLLVKGEALGAPVSVMLAGSDGDDAEGNALSISDALRVNEAQAPVEGRCSRLVEMTRVIGEVGYELSVLCRQCTCWIENSD